LYGSVLGAAWGLGAMIVTRRMSMQTAIPFGPFLAIGAVAHLVVGFQLKEWLFTV